MQNIDQAAFNDTGYSYTLSLIQGKHKMVILYCLMEFQPVRFNQMRRYLGRISDKTLSQNLKELEADGLISRTVFAEVPPRVEYEITQKARGLGPTMEALTVWWNQYGRSLPGKPTSRGRKAKGS